MDGILGTTLTKQNEKGSNIDNQIILAGVYVNRKMRL